MAVKIGGLSKADSALSGDATPRIVPSHASIYRFDRVLNCSISCAKSVKCLPGAHAASRKDPRFFSVKIEFLRQTLASIGVNPEQLEQRMRWLSALVHSVAEVDRCTLANAPLQSELGRRVEVDCRRSFSESQAIAVGRLVIHVLLAKDAAALPDFSRQYRRAKLSPPYPTARSARLALTRTRSGPAPAAKNSSPR